MRKIPASDVVQDLSIYPRCAVDEAHVASLVLVLEAGNELPPIVICRKTRKVTDGFHRLNAHGQYHGWESEIAVVEKDYADVREMWLDAIRYNAKHGLPLSASDREQCVLKSIKLGVDGEHVALAFGVRREAIVGLTTAPNRADLRPAAKQPELAARSSVVQQRHDEDLELLAAHHAGDATAMERLLEKYDGLCRKLANRAPNNSNEFDDYYQQARLSFIQYASRFDPASGVLLMTYLHRCIEGQMIGHFRQDSVIVHSRNQAVQSDAPTRNLLSLSARGESGKALLEIGKPDADLNAECDLAEKLANVKESARHLSDREREVVQRRLDGESLVEIGDDFGVSKERVRQIEERAVGRLKRMSSVHTDSLYSFQEHVSWISAYLNRNRDRLTRIEIDALTQLSLAIDDLTEAAA